MKLKSERTPKAWRSANSKPLFHFKENREGRKERATATETLGETNGKRRATDTEALEAKSGGRGAFNAEQSGTARGKHRASAAFPEIRYYTDERRDDLSGIERRSVRIDGSYRYLHQSLLWRLAECLVYRVIMTPIAALWCRLKYRVRIVGREKLRACGRFGCFLYGNHTLMDGDAFLPTLCCFPKKTAVVVSPDNLAVPLTRRWIELCGAIPVPTELSATRPFLNALEKHTLLGHAVAVYPEAHVWPYCSFIRDYPSDAFRYPVRFSMPSYAMTVVHRKPRGRRRQPDVTVYVDGPFYPDSTLSDRAQAQELRDRIHAVMVSHAKESDLDRIRYVKREEGEA